MRRLEDLLDALSALIPVVVTGILIYIYVTGGSIW